MEPLRWELPYGVTLAFSTVADGDQRDPERRRAWLAAIGCPGPCVVPDQVHGVRVATVPPPPAPGSDGVATVDRRMALGVFGADCPGLCLATPAALVLAHCGWRGVAAGIVAQAVAALAVLDPIPRAQWRAFIGPGIAGAAYEVDAPVLRARAWPPSALRRSAPDRARLDLPTVIAADLAACGVTAVARAAISTDADPRLHSYRRRGGGLVQLLAAWRG